MSSFSISLRGQPSSEEGLAPDLSIQEPELMRAISAHIYRLQGSRNPGKLIALPSLTKSGWAAILLWDGEVFDVSYNVDIYPSQKHQVAEAVLARLLGIDAQRVIRVTDPDLLERIEEVEGMKHTLCAQSGLRNDHPLKLYKEWSSQADPLEIDSTVPTGIVIQGVGGLHRFPVRGDGEVVFSGNHAGGDKWIARAKAVGFRLA